MIIRKQRKLPERSEDYHNKKLSNRFDKLFSRRKL